MQGEKITQLQDAMFTILDSLPEHDYFSIITFSYDVQVFHNFFALYMSQLLLLGKVEYGGGLIFKVVLEC